MAEKDDIVRAVYLVAFVGAIFIGYILFTSPAWAKAAMYYAYFLVIGITVALAVPKIKKVKF